MPRAGPHRPMKRAGPPQTRSSRTLRMSLCRPAHTAQRPGTTTKSMRSARRTRRSDGQRHSSSSGGGSGGSSEGREGRARLPRPRLNGSRCLSGMGTRVRPSGKAQIAEVQVARAPTDAGGAGSAGRRAPGFRFEHRTPTERHARMSQFAAPFEGLDDPAGHLSGGGSPGMRQVFNVTLAEGVRQPR